MALTPGTRLGVYEVTAQIGEGGMGQVYRATDTKLKRQVAIKILPPAFAADHDRLVRFQREAEVLASLNHPHIAAIYGLEEGQAGRAGLAKTSDSPSAPAPPALPALPAITFIVMELVEGEDLSQRIDRGAMPMDEVLPIAKQIAEALEAAHEQGIIHRDLKPANIKVRPDGTVKVLDFGLAKAIDGAGTAGGAGRAGGVTNSPTITSPAMTQAGMILGTAAYMSPEQARGRLVDRRADIWAFGCVLFEMFSGRRAFPGEDVTDTLAAVVRADPDWSVLPQGLSPTLLVFLKRSLQKDPKQRVGDVHDLRLALDGAFDVAAPSSAALPVPPRWRSAGPRWMAFAAAAVVTVAFAIPAIRHLREIPSEERSLRLSIPLPASSQVGYLEMSPDGKRLVAGIVHESRTQLQIRALDGLEWQPLPGTDNARAPFWSPDSRFIGFFSDGSLRVIPAAGGPSRVLCPETGLGAGGTWSSSNVILFANERGELRRVDAAGATCDVVGMDDPNSSARLPVFLPDGHHFFYLSTNRGDGSSRGVYLAALDNLTPQRILADASGVAYAPSLDGGHAHLLFLRDTKLMAQPFDDGTLTAVGDPVAIVSQATVTFTVPQVAATVSMGTLVYLAGQSRETQLTWFDQSGKALGTVGQRAERQNVALSPDGNAVLTNRAESNGVFAMWFHDVPRGSESRFLPPGSPRIGMPVWSSDSRRVLFRLTDAPTGPGLYEKDGSGSGQPTLVSPIGDASFAPSWLTGDGRFLVYTLVDSKTQADIWYVPMDPKPDFGKAVKFAATSAMEGQGQVSPNGKWLAYVSNETGQMEVSVRPFPDGPGVSKISPDGGREPRWSADGKQIYYMRPLAGDRFTLMATTPDTDGRGGLRAGTPRRLFDFRARVFVPQNNIFTYSPHPDGQRFLVNAQADEGETTINVITNWQKTISDRKVP